MTDAAAAALTLAAGLTRLPTRRIWQPAAIRTRFHPARSNDRVHSHRRRPRMDERDKTTEMPHRPACHRKRACDMSLKSRRFTIRAFAAVIMTILIRVSADAQQNTGPAQPPNIVYIIADDQGWKDVGYHGSDIRTPNIDKLAADGARLEQFYAQPMCTPTRAALMTGRYPFRYGLQTAVIPSDPHLRAGHRRVAPAAGAEGGRLQNGDHRQMASRPRRSEVLAAAARLRSTSTGRSSARSTISPTSSTACWTGIATTSRCARRVTRRPCSATTR